MRGAKTSSATGTWSYAFLTVAGSADVTGLLAVLAPGVVRRANLVVLPAGVPIEFRGAQEVAKEAAGNAAGARLAVAVLVDGKVGAVGAPRGHLALVLTFMCAGHQIAAIEVVADPQRLDALDQSLLTS